MFSGWSVFPTLGLLNGNDIMALNQKERAWIQGQFDKVNDLITNARLDIAGLKVKSGIWGLIGGSIPVLITIVLYICLRK